MSDITMKHWQFALLLVALGAFGQLIAPAVQKTFRAPVEEAGPSTAALWNQADEIGNINTWENPSGSHDFSIRGIYCHETRITVMGVGATLAQAAAQAIRRAEAVEESCRG